MRSFNVCKVMRTLDVQEGPGYDVFSHSCHTYLLTGVPPGGLRRIILTASGGAFRDYSKDDLFRLCSEDPSFVQKKATTHPNWDMGAKITLDSATMMNKGLEVTWSALNKPSFISGFANSLSSSTSPPRRLLRPTTCLEQHMTTLTL